VEKKMDMNIDGKLFGGRKQWEVREGKERVRRGM
jgi:hypothetical protein